MHLLTDSDYTKIATEAGFADARRARQAGRTAQPDRLAEPPRRRRRGPHHRRLSPRPRQANSKPFCIPKPGEWPTYYGTLNGNRYSTLDQINATTPRSLQLQWIYPIQYQPLETTPLVAGGMMFVTGPEPGVSARCADRAAKSGGIPGLALPPEP